MRIRILAVGRLKSGAERELSARYLERARAAGRQIGLTGFDIVEIAESRQRDEDGRRVEEGRQLVERISAGACRIALDENGRQLSSLEFAELVGNRRDSGAPEITFVLGGPDGHAEFVRQEAEIVLALGAMTWPHQLVRTMLAEQLYRAVTILCGHPYHRA